MKFFIFYKRLVLRQNLGGFLPSFLAAILFLFAAAAPFRAPAQDIQEISKEIHLESGGRAAAQEKALRELSRELVVEAIGEEKYERNKKRIEEKIIKNKNRYILSLRASKLEPQDEGGFLSVVKIKFSKNNLKALLLEHNLFYASQSSSCLLPAPIFSSQFEGRQDSYVWWLDDSSSPLLQSLAERFFELLGEELIKKGFYALNPVFQRMKQGAPSSVLPGRSARMKNFAPLADFYSCDIILSGRIHIGEPRESSSFDFINFAAHLFGGKTEGPKEESPYWTQFFFNVFNIKTRQFLFKIKRKFLFPSSLRGDPKTEALSRFKDILGSLSYQLSSYQEEGSLDLNRLMIGVQGRLSYADQEKFKKALEANIAALKNLEARLLSSNRIIYAADSPLSAKFIADQLKKTKIKGFFIQVKGYKNQELEVYVKKIQP